jgi:hypothetical protein
MSPGSSTPSNCFARNSCPSAAMMSGQHRIEAVLAGWGFVEKRSNKKGTSWQEVYFNHQWLFYSTLCYATLFYSSPCTPSKTSVTWSFSRKFPIKKGLSSIAVMNFRVGHQTLLPFVVLIFQELPTLYPSFWDFLSSNRTIEGFHGFCGGSSATLPTARSHPAREGVFSCHTTHRHRVMRIKKIRQRLG